MTVVVDSSALLALIKREPGFERVYDVIDDAVASPVILAETLWKAERLGYKIDPTEAMFMGAGLRLSDVDIDDIRLLAKLHARPGVNISLADSFCLALAMRLVADYESVMRQRVGKRRLAHSQPTFAGTGRSETPAMRSQCARCLTTLVITPCQRASIVVSSRLVVITVGSLCPWR